jgi:hypothetical protein
MSGVASMPASHSHDHKCCLLLRAGETGTSGFLRLNAGALKSKYQKQPKKMEHGYPQAKHVLPSACYVIKVIDEYRDTKNGVG